MDLQEDRVSLSGLGPEQIKRKLQHYKDSGGDSALLGHFISPPLTGIKNIAR